MKKTYIINSIVSLFMIASLSIYMNKVITLLHVRDDWKANLVAIAFNEYRHHGIFIPNLMLWVSIAAFLYNLYMLIRTFITKDKTYA